MEYTYVSAQSLDVLMERVNGYGAKGWHMFDYRVTHDSGMGYAHSCILERELPKDPLTGPR